MIPTRLRVSFLLGLPLAYSACGGDGLTLPQEGEPAHIAVMEGSGQSGRVGSTLTQPLQVLVTDTKDRPVANATVLFSFSTTAAGEAVPASATTNADGLASSTLKLGSTPGALTGKAEVPVDEGTTPVETSFTATALPDDANSISLLSGDGQSAPVNSALPNPLVVKVTDAFGNPVSGVTIAWTITGDGSVSAPSTVSDANGQASVTRTLGGTAGTQTTSATAEGLVGSPVTFTHIATAGSATGVVKVSGDNQSALVGTELAQPLVVQVLDAIGNPIPNQPVTWVVSDGSPNPMNTMTDANGQASTRWTLGSTPGDKTATAVVSPVGTATFNAKATAGGPSASNSIVSANPENIVVGSGSSTITVTVRDGGNNPVGDVAVSLQASGTGNTITPASASTGSNGVATFTFSSTVAETKTITATAGGVTLTDEATVTVQKVASSTRITRDEPDRSTAGETVTVEYTVTGAGGPPTGTVTITVSGGTETCSAPVAAGQCDIQLDNTGNPRVLTATYSGDDRFNGSTDTELHRVDPAPAANIPPVAAFTPPTCTVGQPCQFTDASTDADGTISSRSWTFQDAAPPTSNDPNPSVVFSTEGSKTVTLTVTDNRGGQNTSTQQVIVNAAAPINTPPTAVNDGPYSSLVFGQPLTVSAELGVLANDIDDHGPLTAQNASDPSKGSVILNADGSFTYTPDPLALGDDTFTYQVSDGEFTSTATVTISIP